MVTKIWSKEKIKNRFSVIILYLLLFISIRSFIENTVLVVSLFALGVFVGLYLLKKNEKIDNFLFMIFSFAFLLRFILLLWDNSYTLFMNSADVYIYHDTAIRILELSFPDFSEIKGNVTFFNHGTYLAFIYLIFGVNKWIAMSINIIVSLLFSFNIYYLTKKIFNSNTARIALFIILFLPSFLFYSVSLLRDFNILFLISLILIFICYSKKRNVVVYSFLSSPFLYLIQIIRPYQAFSIGCAVLFNFGVKLLNNKKFKTLFYVIFISIVAMAYLGHFSNSFAKMEHNNQARSIGRTAYGKDTSFDTFENYIKNIPIASAYHLYSPFLFNIDTFVDFVAFVESKIILVLSIFSFIAVLYARKTKYEIITILLFYATINTLIFAPIDSNIGTAVRHRMISVFIFVILGSYPISKLLKKNKNKTF